MSVQYENEEQFSHLSHMKRAGHGEGRRESARQGCSVVRSDPPYTAYSTKSLMLLAVHRVPYCGMVAVMAASGHGENPPRSTPTFPHFVEASRSQPDNESQHLMGSSSGLSPWSLSTGQVGDEACGMESNDR